MSHRSSHEPAAPVMSAEDVRDDAKRLATVLRRNRRGGEPGVNLRIPLTALLAALDQLDPEGLRVLSEHIEARLKAETDLRAPGESTD